MTTWELEDLVGNGDIADMAGVGPSTVSNWMQRYPDFPAPLVTVSKNVKLFSGRQVRRWLVHTCRIEGNTLL